MQLHIREGAKTREVLLKCEYVPLASVLAVTKCTSVLVEVGRGSKSRVWIEI